LQNSGSDLDFTALKRSGFDSHIGEKVLFQWVSLSQERMRQGTRDKLLCDGVKCQLLCTATVFKVVFHVDLLLVGRLTIVRTRAEVLKGCGNCSEILRNPDEMPLDSTFPGH
jgi:hypothetical protein